VRTPGYSPSGRGYDAWYSLLMRIPIWLGLGLWSVGFALLLGVVSVLVLGPAAWTIAPITASVLWPACLVMGLRKGWNLRSPPPTSMDTRRNSHGG
jgi:hypothetical protein